MDLVKLPIKTLRQLSKRIDVFDDGLRSLIAEMGVVMMHENGIGLAAPQIDLNIMLVIVRHGETDRFTAFINPEITFTAKKTVAIEEGCLSIPGVYGYVERASKIRIQYHDEYGVKKIHKASGMEAIILQHEIDHINGRLIIDHPLSITKGHDVYERLRL